ncbi:MAG: endonuclease [Rhodoglobus sp.]|nr:endonuclease [Rhodoglobus sp.]
MPESDTLAAAFIAAVDALARVSKDVADYRILNDAALLELNRLAAVERQFAEAHAALLAGEIAHRSAPALGHAGLAQRSGYRTPEELVRVSTRSTAREASVVVRVGRLVHDAQSIDSTTGELVAPEQPWLLPVTEAITAGILPLASADAIRTGLGEPCDGVPSSSLADAAARLCAEGTTLDPDRLFRRARELRDELDEAGIADRERERRQRRSLRLVRQPDGMVRLTWVLDPESAAVAVDLYDRATSPRRGGPRFVAQAEAEAAERILADTRTTEQLASDVFLDLLRQGADADDSQLLGTGAPVIRVLVTAKVLRERSGHGRIDGQPDPISFETIERMLCSGSTLPIVFDGEGQPLDLGREQRLYSRRQCIALAARDGGCRVNGCGRPASWTEAHHVQHWGRDGGKTTIANGILLCRHHHLLLHNNGWEITRDGADYWLVPPPDIDPDQTPIPMPSKSGALKDLQRERAS